MSSAFIKSSINLEANYGLLSLKIIFGTPYNFQTLSLQISAIYSDNTVVVVV